MTDESTAIEQPADSIEDEIKAAFNDLSAEDTEADEVDTPEVETEEQEGDETEVLGEETEEEPEIAAEEETEEEVAGLEAPDHWPAERKELFKKQPQEVQEFLMERHNEMEADYTRKTQELAEVRNELGPYWEKFAAQRGNLQRQGVTTSQYLENLTNADLMMNRDPVAGIQQIAQMYGVDLTNPQITEAQNIDPNTQALKQELDELKSFITNKETETYNSTIESLQTKISSFADEKTEAGDVAHPYFDDVLNDMITLAKAEQAQGKTPEVEELYEQAVWANPATREKQLAADKAAQAAKEVERARAKAAKAKKASTSVTGSPDVSGAAVEMSLEEELRAAYRG